MSDTVQLKDGDGVSLPPDVTEFLFGCCDCGLVHRITVNREGDNTVIKFYRVGDKNE